jgi:hypothetical protein
MADQTQVISFGKDAISQLQNLISASSGVARNSSAGQNNERKMAEAAKDTVKSHEDLSQSADTATQSVNKLNKAYRAYNNKIESNYDAMNQFEKIVGSSAGSLKKQSAILSGLIENTHLSNEALDKHTEQLLDGAKDLKMLNFANKSLMRSTNAQISSARELNNAQEALALRANFLQDSFKQFSDLAGEVERLNKLSKAKLTKEEAELLMIVEGLNLKKLDNKSLKDGITASRLELRQLQTRAYFNLKQNEALKLLNERTHGAVDIFKGTVGPVAIFSSALGLLSAGMKGVWEQLKIVSEGGMYGHMLEINAAQIELGVSFEQATKLFTENVRIMNSVGGRNFTNAINTAQHGLMELGLSVAESTEMASNMTKNAALNGVDVRDQNKLKKATDLQTAAFAKLRASTTISAQEFMSMNDELSENSDVQAILNGLNQIDRTNKIQDMTNLRQDFVNLGMSAQGAQKSMLAIQSMGQTKVVDRFNKAAKIFQALVNTGVDEKKARIASDAVRLGSQASPEQQRILAEAFQTSVKTRDAAYASGDFKSQNINDKMSEAFEGNQLYEEVRKANLTKDATGKLTPEQLAKQTAGTKVSETQVIVAKSLAVLEQIAANPWLKVIGSAALAIAAAVIYMKNRKSNIADSAAFQSIKEHVASLDMKASKPSDGGFDGTDRYNKDKDYTGNGERMRKRNKAKRTKTTIHNRGGGVASAISSMSQAMENSSGCCCSGVDSSSFDYSNNQKNKQRGKIDALRNGGKRLSFKEQQAILNSGESSRVERTGSALKNFKNKTPALESVLESSKAATEVTKTASKWSKLGKIGSKISKGSVGGIVTSLAVDFAGEKLQESGHEQAAAVADLASDVIGMASTGAMIGSFIMPGIGTAIGAAVGGLAGGAINLANGGLEKIIPATTANPSADDYLGLTNNVNTDALLAQAAGIKVNTPIATPKPVHDQPQHTLGELSKENLANRIKDSSTTNTGKSSQTDAQLLAEISTHLAELKELQAASNKTGMEHLSVSSELVATTEQQAEDLKYKTTGNYKGFDLFSGSAKYNSMKTPN